MSAPGARSVVSHMPASAYNATVRQQAVDWVARHDAGELSAAEQVAFAAWLRADPAHAEAWQRARRTWTELDGLHATQVRPGHAVGHRSMRRHARGKSATPVRRAAWAGTAAAVLVALAAWQYPRMELAWRADAQTATGQSRQLLLAGGSRALLDSRSAVAWRDNPRWRELDLLEGAVSIEVGHADPRPFRARVGEIVVDDVGTVFQLRRDDAGTKVTVTHGMVRIHAPGGDATVAAGEQAWIVHDDSPRVSVVDAEAASAWTRGRLVFVNRPLSEVIDELNRYYPGRIVLLDPATADRHVSGVFRTGEPLVALDAIEKSLGLKSYRLALGVIVLRG